MFPVGNERPRQEAECSVLTGRRVSAFVGLNWNAPVLPVIETVFDRTIRLSADRARVMKVRESKITA